MARAATTLASPPPLPESDCLPGILHPRENTALFGHDKSARTLHDSFASGRMHHAWLFCGPAGIGKATLAYRLARHVFSPAPGTRDSPLPSALDQPPAYQIRAGSHPGLLVLRRQWDPKRKAFQTTIPVDEVRRLKSFFGLSAGENAWRIVIVDRADDMNANAANALLKSLEEPPARCLFLLIASQPGRLPVTIHSRCRTLDIPALTANALETAVDHVAAASNIELGGDIDRSALARLAHGSVRRALLLASDGGLQAYADIEAILSTAPRIDFSRVFTLAEPLGLAANEPRYNATLDLLSDLLSRLIHQAATGAQNQSGSDGETSLAGLLIAPGTVADWAALWETLARDRGEVRLLNLDRQEFVVSIFQRIEALLQRSTPA